MIDTPRTLALNLRLGHADDARAQRAFHDLAEQLERELAEAYRLAVDPAASLDRVELKACKETLEESNRCYLAQFERAERLRRALELAKDIVKSQANREQHANSLDHTARHAHAAILEALGK